MKLQSLQTELTTIDSLNCPFCCGIVQTVNPVDVLVPVGSTVRPGLGLPVYSDIQYKSQRKFALASCGCYYPDELMALFRVHIADKSQMKGETWVSPESLFTEKWANSSMPHLRQRLLIALQQPQRTEATLRQIADLTTQIASRDPQVLHALALQFKSKTSCYFAEKSQLLLPMTHGEDPSCDTDLTILDRLSKVSVKLPRYVLQRSLYSVTADLAWSTLQQFGISVDVTAVAIPITVLVVHQSENVICHYAVKHLIRNIQRMQLCYTQLHLLTSSAQNFLSADLHIPLPLTQQVGNRKEVAVPVDVVESAVMSRMSASNTEEFLLRRAVRKVRRIQRKTQIE